MSSNEFNNRQAKKVNSVGPELFFFMKSKLSLFVHAHPERKISFSLSVSRDFS